jgi:UrcA family protein
MFTRSALIATLTLATFAGAAVHAQTSSDPIRVTVSYADLNVATTDGAKTLVQRIEAAADRACGYAPDQRLLADLARYQSCRKQAIDTAVAAVDSPTVTAMAGRLSSPTRLAGR